MTLVKWFDKTAVFEFQMTIRSCQFTGRISVAKLWICIQTLVSRFLVNGGDLKFGLAPISFSISQSLNSVHSVMLRTSIESLPATTRISIVNLAWVVNTANLTCSTSPMRCEATL